jgi:hypothetical protein
MTRPTPHPNPIPQPFGCDSVSQARESESGWTGRTQTAAERKETD